MLQNWLIGVILATLASIISNLGLNLQKLNHTLNEQRIRQQLREERRKAHAAQALAGLEAGTAYGAAGSKILHDDADTKEAAVTLALAQSYQNEPTAGFGVSDMTRPQRLVHAMFPNSEPTTMTAQAAFNAKPAYPSALPPSQQTVQNLAQSSDAAYDKLNTVNYSRQTMWRAGLGLVVLGSLGDFVALIFASQSLVAPLGSLTLVANTFFAPLLLGETISPRDLVATCAIVLGSAIAVATADHSDAIYTIDQLFGFFATKRFAVYAITVVTVLGLLFWWKQYLTALRRSSPRAYLEAGLAKSHRFTYAALAGIMGAQSVLFAKCTGVILVGAFAGQGTLAYWQSYLILAAMFGTIFLQIRWLNSGLRNFESLFIVPIFQSFWLLVSVVAGMIFFGEYRHIFTDYWSSVFFPIGVLTTIVGVYVLSQRGGEQLATGTPRNTPLQRNYRHYGVTRPVSASPAVSPLPPSGVAVDIDRFPQAQAASTTIRYDAAHFPSATRAEDQSIPASTRARVTTGANDEYGTGDEDAAADGAGDGDETVHLLARPSSPQYWVSPAPPSGFMSMPFLDARFVAATSAPHGAHAPPPTHLLGLVAHQHMQTNHKKDGYQAIGEPTMRPPTQTQTQPALVRSATPVAGHVSRLQTAHSAPPRIEGAASTSPSASAAAAAVAPFTSPVSVPPAGSPPRTSFTSPARPSAAASTHATPMSPTSPFAVSPAGGPGGAGADSIDSADIVDEAPVAFIMDDTQVQETSAPSDTHAAMDAGGDQPTPADDRPTGGKKKKGKSGRK